MLRSYCKFLGLSFAGLGAVLLFATITPVTAQVFDADPTASTGIITTGTGQGLYGNFGLGANGTTPPANTYNVYRKYQPDTGGVTLPLNELTPEAGNNSVAEWTGLEQGNAAFGGGFIAPGMFIGTSPSTSSYSDQLVNFGPVIGNANSQVTQDIGDPQKRRDWDLRVGFFEEPNGWTSTAAPNSGDQDMFTGAFGTDAVYLNINIGSSDSPVDVPSPGDPAGDPATGNSNWYTYATVQTTLDPDDVPGVYSASAISDAEVIINEVDRDTPTDATWKRAGSGTDLGTIAANQKVDTLVPYDENVEVSWNMELNDPGNADPVLAREVLFSAKIGNVVFENVFDPGAAGAGNEVEPNPTLEEGVTYKDGFFDWQNATPVFFAGMHNQTEAGASATQGIFQADDFDGSGATDGGDLDVWENNYSAVDSTFSTGDGTQDGSTNGADFLNWQRSAGGAAVAAVSSAVPEPTSLVLGSLVLFCWSLTMRSRRDGA